MKVLGFDIGIRSIGWAFVEDGELKDAGVRIPTKAENPKTGESLALPRREARGVRRRLNRRKVRLNELKRLICAEFGLNLSDFHAKDGELPLAYRLSKCEIAGYDRYEKRNAIRKGSDTAEQERLKQELDQLDTNPYKLRTQALKDKLTPDELARVILHIAKHRGYGNKHARKENNKDKGAVLSALKNNEKALTAYKSVGEYLYKDFYQKGHKVRNTTDVYERCMRQEWLQDELKLIFKKQREFGFKFSDEFKDKVLEIAFFQRPLKSYADKVGFCTFFPNEKRAPQDSLSAIEYVALGKIINELKYIEKKWKKETGEEIKDKFCTTQNINAILEFVLKNSEISYKEIRSILKLDENFKNIKIFSKNVKLDYTQKTIDEAEKAKFLELKYSKDNPNIPNLKGFQKALGESYEKLDRKTLDDIAFDLATINDKQELLKELEKYDLNDKQKEAISQLTFSKFLNLSYKALNEIIPLMKQGLRNDEAVAKLGFKPSDEYDYKEVQNELHNPVVSHILAEVVKVLKAILEKHGQVHKINIEFTREAGISRENRKKIEWQQKQNFQANEQAKKMCYDIGIAATKRNILKIKLWREQGENCVYSGKRITIAHLQDETMLQIDHIYPYSRSFDDSYSNKVLVFTEQNQIKRERTPFEAFGSDTNKWNTIVSFVKGNKAYYTKTNEKTKKKELCFTKKGQKILDTEFKEREQGFIQRNLVDTSYIANVVRDYIEKNVKFLPLDDEELKQSTMFFELDNYNEKDDAKREYKRRHIEIISGNLTSTMKHYWGLHFLDKKNEYGEYEKDRNHHLHHALDAIIIAYMNASRVKAFSDFKKKLETMKASEYAEKLSNEEKEQERIKRKKSTFEVPSKYANRNEFESKIKEKIDEIFVSKPPRKRARGALHLETFTSLDDKDLLETYGGKNNPKEIQKLGVQRAVALGKVRQIGTKVASNGAMVRTDIFCHKASGKFYGVPIYTMDFALGVLPNKAVVGGKDKSGVIKDWLEMNGAYEFCFSLFKDDLIRVQKKEMDEAELCYYVNFVTSNAQINVEKHDNYFATLTENQKLLFNSATEQEVVGKSIGIQGLKVFEKWQVSPLGECEFKASAEQPETRQEISLKSTHKKHKRRANSNLSVNSTKNSPKNSQNSTLSVNLAKNSQNSAQISSKNSNESEPK